MVPEALAQLPLLTSNILTSSVTVAGFCAIIVSWLMPDDNSETSNTLI
ncbi:MAG: xanthine permease XanP [Paraglaciecola sp.]|jgi:xanthine permease XanP